MALGAQRLAGAGEGFSPGRCSLALTGVALGTLGSFAFKQVDRVPAVWHNTDEPGGLLGRKLLLCAVALVAAYVPARRASRIEPLQALRAE